MSTTRWRRVALIGGTATVLALAGVGWALAADRAPGAAKDAVDAIEPGAAEIDAAFDAAARGPVGAGPALHRGGALRRLIAARHLVHAEVRYVDRAGEIVEHRLDHGVIRAIGDATITIDAADGNTVTVATDGETLVRLGRARGSLDDLRVGDDVVVHGRVEAGTTLARHVVRLPPLDRDPGG